MSFSPSARISSSIGRSSPLTWREAVMNGLRCVRSGGLPAAREASSLVLRSPQPSACCLILTPGNFFSNSAMLVSWMVLTVWGSTSVCQTCSSFACWPRAAGARPNRAGAGGPGGGGAGGGRRRGGGGGALGVPDLHLLRLLAEGGGRAAQQGGAGGHGGGAREEATARELAHESSFAQDEFDGPESSSPAPGAKGPVGWGRGPRSGTLPGGHYDLPGRRKRFHILARVEARSKICSGRP